MKKLGITTESAADLPEKIIEKYNIGIVSFKVDLEKVKDFPGNMFEKMRMAEKKKVDCIVKTSQPSIADYVKLFKEKLNDFEEIIHVSTSSKVSGAYNSAIQATKFLGAQASKVHILDSLKSSAAEGLLVIKAQEDIVRGLSLKEIIDNFNRRIKDTFIIFMYDKPIWVQAGGRFPKITQVVLQKMKDFNISIVMREKGGVLKPMTIRNNVKELAEPIFEEFKKFTEKTKRKISVVIVHADNEIEALKLKEKVETLKNVKVLYVKMLDVVLGAHAGPGSLLINFIYE
ncbi:MAG: DegV family protein [Candidatus Pacebacteria bacterium]|nr:DegV family protein [Candidatus Paceibacterota bacterium]